MEPSVYETVTVQENQDRLHAVMAYAQSDAMESAQHRSPLQQYNDGVRLNEIQCNEPRSLYITNSEIPVCIYPDTYQTLLDRGVSMSQPATPESVVRAAVEGAMALYNSDPDGAFDSITAMMSTDPSYPFVLNATGHIVAHGLNPDWVGLDGIALAQSDELIGTILSELEEGEYWWEYTFTNPATGTEQFKRSLLVLHGDYIFGSGYYAASDDAMSLLELTPEEEAWLEENGTVRVAFDPGWFPIEYADEEGNLTGVTLQYMAEFSRLTGADFVGVPAAASWNEALVMMQNGEADVMYMVADTPERLEYMGFTTVHYTLETRIITPDDRHATLDDKDLRIITIEGYSIEEWLDENYPDVEYTSVGSFAEGLDLMKTDEANAFAATWPIIVTHAATAGIDVYDAGPTGYKYDLHVGYSDQNPILGSILQKTVDAIPASQVEQWWDGTIPATDDTMMEDKTTDDTMMEDKTTDNAMSLLELTPEEEAWLDEHGTVRVAFDPDWFPIEYADEEGNLAGVTLQYASAFSKITGADFAGVSATASWNETLAMMQNGDADVIFMIVSTPEWLEYMGFTTAHYAVETRIITPDDRQATLDDEDLNLVTISGYLIDAWLDENYPDVEYTSVGGYAEGLELMNAGEANAFAATWPVVRAHAEDVGMTVYDAGPTGYQYDMRIGYGNQDPILGSILQKAVDAIPASQVELWWNDAVY